MGLTDVAGNLVNGDTLVFPGMNVKFMRHDYQEVSQRSAGDTVQRPGRRGVGVDSRWYYL